MIFFNEKEEFLILKPDYKPSWLIPGGSNDDNESPLACAQRETAEEIGIHGKELRLVGVYHSPRKGIHADSLKFVFFGGVLTDEEIASITLQHEELEAYAFNPLDEAVPMLSSSLQKCIPACVNAIRAGGVAYLEE